MFSEKHSVSFSPQILIDSLILKSFSIICLAPLLKITISATERDNALSEILIIGPLSACKAIYTQAKRHHLQSTGQPFA
ncbi:MAG: hypothetical protein ACI87J_002109 [Colwellia sp.]|jgi:hypothetical protein